MRIQKQVYDLSVEDFQKYPVWEFASDEEHEDGQDEATVRPCMIAAPINPSQGPFIVRAKFKLADGTLMSGYLTTPTETDKSLGQLQPVIITRGGPVVFWGGTIAPSESELADNYSKLERNTEHTFPLEVFADVDLTTGEFHEAIEGFIVLEDWRTGKTRVVK